MTPVCADLHAASFPVGDVDEEIIALYVDQGVVDELENELPPVVDLA
jgi:hypothetical protein